MQGFSEIDGQILLWIQEHLRNDTLTPFVKGVTYLGNYGALMIAACIVLMIIPNTRKLGLICTAAMVVNVIVNNVMLKNIFDRTRPYEVVDGLRCIVAKPLDPSFPSGHTSASFSVGSVIFGEVPRKIGAAVLVLCAMIAFSRLYVGVHYPTDVLCGMVSGTLIGCFCCVMYHKYISRNMKALHRG